MRNLDAAYTHHAWPVGEISCKMELRWLSHIVGHMNSGHIPWNLGLKNRPNRYGIGTSNSSRFLLGQWYDFLCLRLRRWIHMTQLKVLFALRIAAQFTMAFPALPDWLRGPTKRRAWLVRWIIIWIWAGVLALRVVRCGKRWERNISKDWRLARKTDAWKIFMYFMRYIGVNEYIDILNWTKGKIDFNRILTGVNQPDACGFNHERSGVDQQNMGRQTSKMDSASIAMAARDPPGDFEDHKIYDGQERTSFVVISTVSGWWFGTFLISPNSWDDDPIWLIFFRGVETTNQVCCFVSLWMGGSKSGIYQWVAPSRGREKSSKKLQWFLVRSQKKCSGDQGLASNGTHSAWDQARKGRIPSSKGL